MNTPILINELERDEGMRLKPYTDSVGKLTVGVGRNLTDIGITRAEAYFMLNNDLDGVFADLDHRLPWWRMMEDARQRVLANMAFNLGIDRLLKFEHALAYMMTRRYSEAAGAMLESKWAQQVGPRAVRLADMMRRGIAEEGGT